MKSANLETKNEDLGEGQKRWRPEEHEWTNRRSDTFVHDMGMTRISVWTVLLKPRSP